MTGKAYNDVDDGGSRVVILPRIAVIGIIYIIPGIIEYFSKENNRNFIYIVFKFLRVGEEGGGGIACRTSGGRVGIRARVLFFLARATALLFPE